MDELSILDEEEIMLLVGSGLSLLYTISFAYSILKVFLNKLKYSQIPLTVLIFSYLNNIIWYYYSDYLYHTFMQLCYQISNYLIWIYFLIYFVYQLREDKIDMLLNFAIIISSNWVVRKLVVDILDDEMKTKICASLSTFCYLISILEWINTAYLEKNINILNIFCGFSLLFMTICWIIFGFVYEHKSFLIPNILGLIIACVYIGIYFNLKRKYGDKVIEEDNKENNSNLEKEKNQKTEEDENGSLKEKSKEEKNNQGEEKEKMKKVK